MTIDELIAALESATEGDRDLDREISRALFPDRPPTTDPKLFTLSIEAALTIVPDHLGWELTKSPTGGTFTAAWLWRWGTFTPAWLWRYGDDSPGTWQSSGNRPLPINICIAALRARAEK